MDLKKEISGTASRKMVYHFLAFLLEAHGLKVQTPHTGFSPLVSRQALFFPESHVSALRSRLPLCSPGTMWGNYRGTLRKALENSKLPGDQTQPRLESWPPHPSLL